MCTTDFTRIVRVKFHFHILPLFHGNTNIVMKLIKKNWLIFMSTHTIFFPVSWSSLTKNKVQELMFIIKVRCVIDYSYYSVFYYYGNNIKNDQDSKSIHKKELVSIIILR